MKELNPKFERIDSISNMLELKENERMVKSSTALDEFSPGKNPDKG